MSVNTVFPAPDLAKIPKGLALIILMKKWFGKKRSCWETKERNGGAKVWKINLFGKGEGIAKLGRS